jgi:phosphonate transport system permease protein
VDLLCALPLRIELTLGHGAGLIGAGGIGQLLFDALNAFAYHQLSAIIIVIIVAVTLIDLLSQAMRSRLL